MDRLKPLLPTLKEKKRYLAFEIISKSKIRDFSEVSKAMWASALSYVGTKGVSQMGLWVLAEKYNASAQKGLIKVSHRSLDCMRASLALIKQIGDQPVIVRSLGASGVLAKAEKKYTGG
ncbi:MAG TPA: Rpp14/Pop5 family protein [Candidatus Nanoarchaeia archaeon]|nr:Rpp14/Pop5 family protein [Candidatus Nanoarchaeia archaeon]